MNFQHFKVKLYALVSVKSCRISIEHPLEEQSLLHKCLYSICARLRVWPWESLGILDMSGHVQHRMTRHESLNQQGIVKCIEVKGQSEQ